MRVLVVEDEVRLAHALRRGLRAEGFAVDVAHDGERGLDLARGGGTTRSCSTSCCRGCPATAWCSGCGSSGNWVPVLMLSAKDGEYDQADGLDLGADDYLVKPFS